MIMSQLIHQYISSIQSEFDTQQSTEHSFRSALKTLIESLNTQVLALNESQRIVGVGMPDFTIKDKGNNTVNIWWIEAKDLYVNLDETKNADQLGRYLAAFDNFIYTNNLTFQFYRNGKRVESVSLWTATKSTITWNTSDLFADNITKLERLLVDFLSYSGQTIASSERLARAMAQKAQLIKYAIQTIFADESEQSALHHQYITFKEYLIHDLTTDQFADMYAQTIAYGLFAARLHDPTLPTFSRAEAQNLIPKTTPFIRWLFKQMADDDEFDDRISHIIDDLVHIFLHCNVDQILKTYNRETGRDDPIIHFYETFLWEYDSAMRKKRGVYYTPVPVVQFIVRGVDHLLKEHFGLKMGLADTSRVDHTFMEQGRKITKSVHRVQVLDPATGTGTFLDETVKYIHETYFAWQAGIWKWYVVKDLLPRIRGFEILMASYTMAHLKLGLTIEETLWSESPLIRGGGEAGGVWVKSQLSDERFNIYLTNSLEQPHDNIWSLFSAQLAKESEQASKVKTEQPIMVVMGNPPYSVSSSNKWERIQWLIADYKKDLNERKLNLDDDYVKFIRFAEYFVEKNNEWIIWYITNNTYIDGVTYRQMRKKLMETFDTIYIVDLHGSSKKQESSPDGSKDENVFDIMQWVSIMFAVKTGNSKKLATVYHTDMRGKRDLKYAQLNEQTINSISWTKLKAEEPYYFFVPKDFSAQKKYEEGIKIDELFSKFNSRVESGKDWMIISHSKNSIEVLIGDMKLYDIEFLVQKYDHSKEKILQVLNDIKNSSIVWINYRPFDFRYTLLSPNSQWVLWRPRYDTMKHMIHENLWLVAKRWFSQQESSPCFVSNGIIDRRFWSRPWMQWAESIFPLYLYDSDDDMFGAEMRRPNLDHEILGQIEQKIGMELVIGDRWDDQSVFTPEDLFDYIYAVLHGPSYREMYAEFLKIDFPRVPFVSDQQIWWQMVALGRELRGYHLMESVDMSDISAMWLQYPVDGDNLVVKPHFITSPWEGGSEGVLWRVYINSTQYIANVPAVAREFYIWGYQPAQKRLKDRKDQTLTYDDIIHYQKIIVSLSQTARIVHQIDKIMLI